MDQVVINIVILTTSVLAIVIAVVGNILSYRAMTEARRERLFGAFDQASQMSIQNPSLMRLVHGLPDTVSSDEASAIAYLSLLLDGFQHFYGPKDGNKFEVMLNEMSKNSTFLNRITMVPGNRSRWEVIKKTYYGDFDNGFVRAVDELFDRGRTN